MPDEITCPQCQGRTWEMLGALRIECAFCHGRGVVGGQSDPEENPPLPPKEPPPIWEDRRWQDPAFAHISCRYCFGSREVSHYDGAAGTLVMVPCRCTTER